MDVSETSLAEVDGEVEKDKSSRSRSVEVLIFLWQLKKGANDLTVHPYNNLCVTQHSFRHQIHHSEKRKRLLVTQTNRTLLQFFPCVIGAHQIHLAEKSRANCNGKRSFEYAIPLCSQARKKGCA